MSAEEVETSQVLGCHTEVVKEEVDRLKEAGAIKEVFYPKWLANTVVVKKKEWKVASMYGLHGFEQGVFERSFSLA